MAENRNMTPDNSGEEKETIVCDFCGRRQKDPKDPVYGSRDGKSWICGECISTIHKVMNTKDTTVERIKAGAAASSPQKINIGTPAKIKAYLDQYIEGQEYAKRVLSVAVYNHYKMLKIKHRQEKSGEPPKVELEKANTIIIGPTGCGKTAIIRHLAKKLGVPFIITDATLYTSSGYVGSDVETIIRDLVKAAGGDVEAAQRGIVYIDEIDKTGRKGENLSTTSDPGHEGAQQALLKLLEGTMLEVPVGNNRKHPNAETFMVNTENILFIIGGSFEGIEKIIAKRLRDESGAGKIGFGSKLVDEKNKLFNEYIEKVTVDDLKKFGMLPELLGRVPVVAPMKELTEDQLMSILYRPKNALVKQYQELFAHDGVTLTVTEGAMRAIAQMAIRRKTGARGLRGIMETILNPVMFELPERSENAVLVDVVDGKINVAYEDKEEREAV